MISDTLSDAISDIEDYQRRSCKMYGGLEEQIAFVKKAMDDLMLALQSGPFPDYKARLAALRRQAHFWITEDDRLS